MTAPYTSQDGSRAFQPEDCSDLGELISAFDVITKEAYNQLGSAGQTAFFIGDGLQRAAVSNIFDFLNPRTWTPANVFRLSSLAARQAGRISELVTSPETACLAWHELQNKIEVFVTVRAQSSLLGISTLDIHLPSAVEKAYSLPPFQALWALEGLGHNYAASHWSLHGSLKGLLWEENADVPESSLLMLHAGLGLFLADWLLGSGTPTLVPNSPFPQFRAVVERFVSLAHDNSRKGYVGPIIESLGLVTRDAYPDMVGSIDAALREVAPDLIGYYWHGVGRALYFSRRYFLPVLCTVWSGIDREARTAVEQHNTMAGLAWAVVLVNMRQPEIIEAMVRNKLDESPLQDGFANGVASSIIMRQETTPDTSFVTAFCRHRPRERRLIPLWNRLISSPCEDALHKYYPELRQRHALGEVFRYQDLSKVSARLEAGLAAPQQPYAAERRAANPWTWQDRLGFSQGIEILGCRRIVYCAGQTSVDGSGNPIYPRDMAKQINQAFDNLEIVLKDAGFTLANVVRLNYYATDLPALSKAAPAYSPRLAAAGCKPVAMALGVTSLFHPELMIEIEATAVG